MDDPKAVGNCYKNMMPPHYLEPLSDIYSGGSPAATLGLLSFTVIWLILIGLGILTYCI